MREISQKWEWGEMEIDVPDQHEEEKLWLLPFGKAAALAQMSDWNFAEEFTKRKITRHYTEEDLRDDIAFANSAEGSNGR